MLEFSAIFSAVKPRQRTGQYVILAAMYCLGAHRKSITTSEINKLLKLHIKLSDFPKNVSASLASYTAYVSPDHPGPPKRWRLTPEGVAKLRSLSGLALKTAVPIEAYNYDIGVVCALEDPEFIAVIDALGGESHWNEAGSPRHSHLYRETTINTSDNKALRVVGTTSTSMGLTAAAIATTQLVHTFKPRLVLMTGIAAGTRSGGKNFGDVLIADPSVDYNSGKVVQQDGIREFLPDPYPIGLYPRLRSLLRRYNGSNELLQEIRDRWQGDAPSSSISIHIGPLGAADQVIDDETRLLEIQKNWRKLIGIEMETYGVYRACFEAPEPKPRFVSMKSVCDFAAHKSDSWQPYAAFTAAQFGFGFLAREWSNLWYEDEEDTA